MNGRTLTKDLLALAEKVKISAEATLSGVGMACFITLVEQEEAFRIAEGKLALAKHILELAQKMQNKYGDFS